MNSNHPPILFYRQNKYLPPLTQNRDGDAGHAECGTYVQAPYEDINEETYEQLAGAMPDIAWSKFVEQDDNTTGTQTLACTAGVCELVNI